MKYITTVNDQTFLIEVLDEHHVSVNGKTMEIDFESVNDQPVYSLIVDGHSFEGFVYPEENQWQVLLRGTLYNVQVEDEREKRLRAASGRGVAPTAEFHLKAPMPGMVVTIPVQEGDTVQKGDVLVILESMKMQNELRAPRKGTVTRIRVKNGDSVEQKQTLLIVE
jgi:biotin carboxyl carrier protein